MRASSSRIACKRRDLVVDCLEVVGRDGVGGVARRVRMSGELQQAAHRAGLEAQIARMADEQQAAQRP